MTDDAIVQNDQQTVAQPYEKIGVNQTFKTTLAGFDKQAVLSYIDNLKTDARQQQRTFTVEIDRLYARNIELSRSVSRYETEISSLSQMLEKEREQVALQNEQNNLLADVVEKMRTRFLELQNELAGQKSVVESLSRDLAAANGRCAALEQAAAMANDRLRTAAGTAASIGGQTQRLNQQIHYLNSQAQERERTFAQRARHYEETIAYFKSNYDRMNGEYNRLRQQSGNVQVLAAQNSQLNQQVNSLSVQAAHLQRELDSQSAYVRSLINELNNLRNSRRSAQPVYAKPAPIQPQTPVFRQGPYGRPVF